MTVISGTPITVVSMEDLAAIANSKATLAGKPYFFPPPIFEADNQAELLTIHQASWGELPGGVVVQRDNKIPYRLTAANYKVAGSWTSFSGFTVVAQGALLAASPARAVGDYVYELGVGLWQLHAAPQTASGSWRPYVGWKTELQRMRDSLPHTEATGFYEPYFPSYFSGELYLRSSVIGIASAEHKDVFINWQAAGFYLDSYSDVEFHSLDPAAVITISATFIASIWKRENTNSGFHQKFSSDHRWSFPDGVGGISGRIIVIWAKPSETVAAPADPGISITDGGGLLGELLYTGTFVNQIGIGSGGFYVYAVNSENRGGGALNVETGADGFVVGLGFRPPNANPAAGIQLQNIVSGASSDGTLNFDMVVTGAGDLASDIHNQSPVYTMGLQGASRPELGAVAFFSRRLFRAPPDGATTQDAWVQIIQQRPIAHSNVDGIFIAKRWVGDGINPDATVQQSEGGDPVTNSILAKDARKPIVKGTTIYSPTVDVSRAMDYVIPRVQFRRDSESPNSVQLLQFSPTPPRGEVYPAFGMIYRIHVRRANMGGKSNLLPVTGGNLTVDVGFIRGTTFVVLHQFSIPTGVEGVTENVVWVDWTSTGLTYRCTEAVEIHANIITAHSGGLGGDVLMTYPMASFHYNDTLGVVSSIP